MNIEIREGEANRAIRLMLYLAERLIDMDAKSVPCEERASSSEAWSAAPPPETFMRACGMTFERVQGASQASAARLQLAVQRAQKWMTDAGVVMEEENVELLAQIEARLAETNSAPVPVTGPVFNDPGASSGTGSAGTGSRPRSV